MRPIVAFGSAERIPTLTSGAIAPPVRAGMLADSPLGCYVTSGVRGVEGVGEFFGRNQPFAAFGAMG